MKRRWVVISAIVGMLVLGLGGGAVMAQEAEPEGGSRLQSLASRVAAILGTDQAQVEDAIQQAKREMQDEALQLKLDGLVEAGNLTQDEADAYRDWHQARPDTGGTGFHGPGHHGRGRGGFGFRGMRRFKGPQPYAPPQIEDGSFS